MVPDSDVADYITRRGKGWICEIENRLVGFAIADLQDNNIWALFIDPAFERQGIVKLLHDKMLNWYFDQNKLSVWWVLIREQERKCFTGKPGGRKPVCMAKAN